MMTWQEAEAMLSASFLGIELGINFLKDFSYFEATVLAGCAGQDKSQIKSIEPPWKSQQASFWVPGAWLPSKTPLNKTI